MFGYNRNDYDDAGDVDDMEVWQFSSSVIICPQLDEFSGRLQWSWKRKSNFSPVGYVFRSPGYRCWKGVGFVFLFFYYTIDTGLNRIPQGKRRANQCEFLEKLTIQCLVILWKIGMIRNVIIVNLMSYITVSKLNQIVCDWMYIYR